MNLREFKEWVDTLPVEFLEYEIVFAEYSVIPHNYQPEDTEPYIVRLDKPISLFDVDEEHKEVLLGADWLLRKGN